MADHTAPGANEFEAMTRQYWNLWGDALRQMGGAEASQAPGWQQALDWWSRLVPGGTPAADDLRGRFRQQSGDWFGLMQQMAARFAGQNASAADITQAWKQMLGADTVTSPWQEMFRTLQGGGAGGFEGWYRQVTPWLDALRNESSRWLHVPAFGLAREHQERWQALALAQQDYQRWLGEYEQLMLRVAQLAFERFEALLTAHSEPGRQITSARALFDLWIDAAEQAYAEVALSPEFRRVYGALTNAQMRLKLGVQREVEQICVMLGMPSRTEVDSAHRKITELERRLRRMEREAERRQTDARPPTRTSAPSASVTAPARRSRSARDVAAADTAPTKKAPAKTKTVPAAATSPRKVGADKQRSADTDAKASDIKRPAASKLAKKTEKAAVVSMKDGRAHNAAAHGDKRKGARRKRQDPSE